jgi:hypothetical protein
MVKESIRLAEATGAFSAIISSLAIIHIVPNFLEMLPKELITSTGATASANGSDDNMDHYFSSDDRRFQSNGASRTIGRGQIGFHRHQHPQVVLEERQMD